MSPMERKVSGAIALIGMMIALAGCNATPAKFQGAWIGKRERVEIPADFRDLEYTLKVVKLEVLPNGRFNLVWNGIPYSGTCSGRDGGIVLDIDSHFNRPFRESDVARSKLQLPITARMEGGIVLLHDLFDRSAPEVRLERDKEAMSRTPGFNAPTAPAPTAPPASETPTPNSAKPETDTQSPLPESAPAAPPAKPSTR